MSGTSLGWINRPVTPSRRTLAAKRAIVGMALAVTFAAGIAPTAAETYRNREFGFTVELPRGAPTCLPSRHAPSTHDHGPDIWLDGGLSGCGELDTRPFVSVIGGYNAAGAVDPEAVARALCQPKRAGGNIVPAPSGLGIKSVRTVACRVDEDDGWISVLVIVQGSRWRPPNDDGLPAINYELTLCTRPERFDADLLRFRSILKTFRLFKPEM